MVRPEMVWGLFEVPERRLGVLGDVAGLDVLELACGTAYCSAWLARSGARWWPSDLSAEQLGRPESCSAVPGLTSR